MKEILLRLTCGAHLSRQEIRHIMVNITRQQYPTEQIAALLMALQVKGITDEELLGFRDGLLETGTHVDLSPYTPIDIVGTGGDGKNTFNISTCACFVEIMPLLLCRALAACSRTMVSSFQATFAKSLKV